MITQYFVFKVKRETSHSRAEHKKAQRDRGGEGQWNRRQVKARAPRSERGLSQSSAWLKRMMAWKSQWLPCQLPPKARRQAIARTFHLQDNYFEKFDDIPDTQTVVLNLPVTLAAKLMGKSRDWITRGLQDGVFPWGYAVKMKDWSYFISSVKFTEYTGIEVPVHQ